MQRQQHGFVLVAQQFGVGQCSGCYHAHHLAFYRTLSRARFANLLTNGDRFAHLDQLGQIVLYCMRRNPGHYYGLPGRLAALGECDAQQPRGLDGVVIEQFIKIAHAVEQQRLREFCFYLQVLGHHGRVAIGNVMGCGHSGNLLQMIGQVLLCKPGCVGSPV